MALTRVVVDWVDIGVGGAEVGVSGECGVTETSPPSNPALASSVIVYSPSTPSPNLTITSLEHIVTKCRYDSERNGKDKESQRRYHSFKPSAACYHLATVKTCEGALNGLGSGWGQVFQGCKVQLFQVFSYSLPETHLACQRTNSLIFDTLGVQHHTVRISDTRNVRLRIGIISSSH